MLSHRQENHEATVRPHPSRRGQEAAPQDEGKKLVMSGDQRTQISARSVSTPLKKVAGPAFSAWSGFSAAVIASAASSDSFRTCFRAGAWWLATYSCRA